jgi:predicted metal-binding membrane protein
MAMLVALGVMSIGWMAVIAAVVTAQALLPQRRPRCAARTHDRRIRVLIIVDPSPVPGLTPPM